MIYHIYEKLKVIMNNNLGKFHQNRYRRFRENCKIDYIKWHFRLVDFDENVAVTSHARANIKYVISVSYSFPFLS